MTVAWPKDYRNLHPVFPVMKRFRAQGLGFSVVSGSDDCFVSFGQELLGAFAAWPMS